MSYSSVTFVAADSPQAQQALKSLVAVYGQKDVNHADVIVALGGDGFMLEALHTHMDKNVPIFGIHRGTIGFLMNKYDENSLFERLNQAEEAVFHPLRMTAVTNVGKSYQALAINEVSMLRQTRQAAKIKIFVDGRERMSELVCDGALVCTPAGSSAYNLSVDGPVLPVGSDILALTPISAFRPRRWRGAILPHTAVIRFVILNPDKRPVSAVADRDEVRDVVEVTVQEDRSIGMRMLFDPEHNLEERIVAEQFQP
ncbi:MAG: NAD kinase [Candidatus Marinimicrobia bacterium]|nr:NAD kinase [Candidatus Neomarinimicrobiota bacterium]|tara:strand:+ start:73 stop:840 length:768 start_codon:yes stop_codon:yes gene_type:complete